MAYRLALDSTRSDFHSHPIQSITHPPDPCEQARTRELTTTNQNNRARRKFRVALHTSTGIHVTILHTCAGIHVTIWPHATRHGHTPRHVEPSSPVWQLAGGCIVENLVTIRVILPCLPSALQNHRCSQRTQESIWGYVGKHMQPIAMTSHKRASGTRLESTCSP